MLIAVWETALVLAIGLAATEGLICPRGVSWWSSERSSCIECTRCKPPLLVLRPCAPHQDAACATLRELQLDWSWLRRPKPRPPQQKERDRDSLSGHEGSGSPYQDLVDDDEDDERRASTEAPDYSERSEYDFEEAESEVDDDGKYVVSVNSNDDVNWESTVLALTVSICLLFGVLICVFAVFYARQWRMLNKSLASDVGGLSTTISLMMASAEAHESMPTLGPDNQYSNLRCAYLEQLLVGKGKDRPPGPGNVYIQENTY